MKNRSFTYLKLQFIIVICIVFQYLSYSQIMLPSSISGTYTLSNTDSFYYSSASISVTGKLIIEEGVEIRMANGSNISMSGELEINGTAENMVLITSIDSISRWGYISANQANININALHVTAATRLIAANYGNIILRDCKLDNTYGGIGSDCIGVHYAEYLEISGCDLNGNPDMPRIDAMDCDGINQGIIRNNIVRNFEDDGVDIGTGTQGIVIENNFIYNCNMGVSVGENSTATLIRNVIVSCDAGIQSHTGSTVTAYNNTLYKNLKGIECHHASQSSSAGNIILNSSIVSQCANSLYTTQTGSQTTFSYSLSDTDPFPGDYNLNTDPMFANPDSMDFNLMEGSPCIDMGDTSINPVDSVQSRIDIGAYEFGYIDTSAIIIPIDTTDTTGTTKPVSVNFNQIEEITIFPLPADQIIYLDLDQAESYAFVIYSLKGLSLMEGVINHDKNKIDISDLASGLYLIMFKAENGLYRTQKFLKR